MGDLLKDNDLKAPLGGFGGKISRLRKLSLSIYSDFVQYLFLVVPDAEDGGEVLYAII
jgi:hypothetical protein